MDQGTKSVNKVSQVPIWIIVFDKLELIFNVIQGLSLLTTSLVPILKPIFTLQHMNSSKQQFKNDLESI